MVCESGCFDWRSDLDKMIPIVVKLPGSDFGNTWVTSGLYATNPRTDLVRIELAINLESSITNTILE